MIIKKFMGKNEEDATQTARKELGTNVVVMNVRSVKKRGILGFFKPAMCEVTVALEEENERENIQERAREKSDENVREALSAIDRVVKQNEDVKAGTPVRSGIEAASRLHQETAPEVKKESVSASRRISDIENRGDILDEKQPAEDLSINDVNETSVKKNKESEQNEEADPELLKFAKLLYNTMISNEVDELYANQVIDEISKINKPGIPFDYALAEVYQKMILKFGQPSGIMPAKQGPKVVFFIGPTGVGKTTTIAKLASSFSVGEKKKVALLTADTYRIAAAEQLRTYADILEVPCRVIYTVEEVEKALRDFKDYDYIMVDTAGHSHQNEKQRENMNSIVHSVDGLAEKEVYLVLSATTKYRDLISISDTYSKITDYKLIFTKLDETTTLGSLFNLKLHTGASISYVTDGQNVPDDIDVFNPQKTVKLLLGGKISS